MARPPAPCGTRAAYERHRRNDETPCAACRKANREASKRDPRGKAYRRARIRALGRLALLYDTAFRALLVEELAKEEDWS